MKWGLSTLDLLQTWKRRAMGVPGPRVRMKWEAVLDHGDVVTEKQAVRLNGWNRLQR
jgi:hypothetical protein